METLSTQTQSKPKISQAIMNSQTGSFLFPIQGQGDDVPSIGQGFDLASGEPIAAQGFNVEDRQLITSPIGKGSSSYQTIKDSQSFKEVLSMALDFSGRGWGAQIGCSTKINTFAQSKKESYLVSFLGFWDSSHKIVSNEQKLSGIAMNILNDPDKGGLAKFYEQYGTHFVAGYITGKRCLLSYILEFSSETSKNDFSAKFEADAKSIGFSVALSGEINNACKASKAHAEQKMATKTEGFKVSVSPIDLSDLATVVKDFNDPNKDLFAPVKVIIYPWTFLDAVRDHLKFTLNGASEDLADAYNHLIYIIQSCNGFLEDGKYTGHWQRTNIEAIKKTADSMQEKIFKIMKNAVHKGEPVDKEQVEPLELSKIIDLEESLSRFSRNFILSFEIEWLTLDGAADANSTKVVVLEYDRTVTGVPTERGQSNRDRGGYILAPEGIYVNWNEGIDVENKIKKQDIAKLYVSGQVQGRVVLLKNYKEGTLEIRLETIPTWPHEESSTKIQALGNSNSIPCGKTISEPGTYGIYNYHGNFEFKVIYTVI